WSARFAEHRAWATGADRQHRTKLLQVSFNTLKSMRARPCSELPQAVHENHCTAMTCAQMASMPMNSASDVKAAASSTTARTMLSLLPTGQNGNDVPVLFQSQGMVASQFDFSSGARVSA